MLQENIQERKREKEGAGLRTALGKNHGKRSLTEGLLVKQLGREEIHLRGFMSQILVLCDVCVPTQLPEGHQAHP